MCRENNKSADHHYIRFIGERNKELHGEISEEERKIQRTRASEGAKNSTPKG